MRRYSCCRYVSDLNLLTFTVPDLFELLTELVRALNPELSWIVCIEHPGVVSQGVGSSYLPITYVVYNRVLFTRISGGYLTRHDVQDSMLIEG